MAWGHQRIDEGFIFGGDLHLQCPGIGVPLRFGARPDDGRADQPIVQHPGNRELDDTDAFALAVGLDLARDGQ